MCLLLSPTTLIILEGILFCQIPFFFLNRNAPINEKEGGTVTYQAKNMKIEKQVFINISNTDMFRMMHNIIRYIEIWEQATCIPNVLQGLQKQKEEFLQAQNNKM